jgi:hypothetical protein
MTSIRTCTLHHKLHIRVIKFRRMRLMGEMSEAYKILVGNLE